MNVALLRETRQIGRRSPYFDILGDSDGPPARGAGQGFPAGGPARLADPAEFVDDSDHFLRDAEEQDHDPLDVILRRAPAILRHLGLLLPVRQERVLLTGAPWRHDRCPSAAHHSSASGPAWPGKGAGPIQVTIGGCSAGVLDGDDAGRPSEIKVDRFRSAGEGKRVALASA
jgi:hypothetical protein